jgi:hypothetical protein
MRILQDRVLLVLKDQWVLKVKPGPRGLPEQQARLALEEPRVLLVHRGLKVSRAFREYKVFRGLRARRAPLAYKDPKESRVFRVSQAPSG